MLRGEFPDAGEHTPESLRAAYEARLADVIESVGVDAVVAESGLDEATVEAIQAGEAPELTLEEAASILAREEGRPDPDTIESEARDLLLLGMTTAVMDVERLSSGIDGAMEPKEIQQKVEGRAPMTLQEYALLHQFLEAGSE